ncbi:MAG: Sec-independent protein translocase protein TatB [Acidimicrobiia bacterium]
MFNLGGGEILVISLIALIVLGPQRLPEAARQVGRVVGELRRLSSGFQNEVRSAFDEAESAPPATSRRAAEAAGEVAEAAGEVAEADAPQDDPHPNGRFPAEGTDADHSGPAGQAGP